LYASIGGQYAFIGDFKQGTMGQNIVIGAKKGVANFFNFLITIYMLLFW
jgi:hypothetical protein